MNFDQAFELLIGNEGVLSMDPKDKGNWANGVLTGSKYGISARSYPELDIANLTLIEAKAIYRQDYWLEGIPDAIAFDLFDTAVNSGVVTAAKLLQRTVGAKEDGVIGPNTHAAMAACQNIKAKFNAARLVYMTDCSGWDSQGKGWARRIAHNLMM